MRPCSATPDGRYRGIPYISDAHSDPRNRPLTIVAFFLFFDGQSSNSIPITIRSIGRGCLKNQTFPALVEHTTRQIGDLVNDDHITPCCDATSPGAISSSALRFPLSQDVHVVPKPLTLCGYSSHITAPRPWKSTRPGFLLLRGPGTPATTAMAFSNYQRQCSTTVQFLCLRNSTWVISSAIDKSLTSPTGNRDMVSAPQSLRQV